MFNFLVTGMEITEPRGSLILGQDRVFLYTDPDLKQRFAPDRVLDEAALLGLPTVITNESGWDRERPVLARVGKVTKVRRGPSTYTVEYTLDADIPPIPNSLLERLAPQLHFDLNTRGGFGDFGTNHWAVKDVDLFRVLFAEGAGRVKPNVFSLPNEPAKQDLVSVMMPFDAGFNRVYGALQQAAANAGMRCLCQRRFKTDTVFVVPAI